MTAWSFEFATGGRLVFGPGRVAELPALAAARGRRVLLCTGASGRHADVLDGADLAVQVVRVRGEPTVEIARAAVAAAREHRADLVVAIGGGAVVDLGKAIGILLGNGGDPLDYLEVIGAGAPLGQPSVPVIAVPTTAGTGSEVTANAVLTSVEHRRKVSLRSPAMLPAVALVDPDLTLSCPPAVTASSGLDALTQCLEPFVTPLATPITDALAAEGLRRAAAGLRRAYTDGADRTARADMSLCSVLGGMSLANAKLGTVHGFAGVIGGMTDAPHGAICAALLAPVTVATLSALRERQPDSPALDRYRQAARLLTGDPAAGADDGVQWIRDTVAALHTPGLASLGLRDTDVEDVVAMTASASSTKGNPIALTEQELRSVLLGALR